MSSDNANARALVFDLETLPIDAAASYLEPIEAPSNYKDPIKIRDYIADAMVRAAEKCSLDPDLCRIALLGMLDEGADDVTVYRAESDSQEAEVLHLFWQRVSLAAGAHRRTISFYGLSFDWPVIIQRSRYLGVPFSMPNIDKYRTPHTDLYQTLTFNRVTPGHGLDFYAKRFELDLPADAIDGSQIAAVMASGQWEQAIAHCRLDVLKTAGIAQRLGLLERTASSQAVA